jgi:hypothetical protein
MTMSEAIQVPGPLDSLITVKPACSNPNNIKIHQTGDSIYVFQSQLDSLIVALGGITQAQHTAALSANEAPLTWTREKPTVEGFYWFKGTVEELTFDSTILFYDAAAEPHFRIGRKWVYTRDMHGEFAGPIQPPQPLST